MEPVHPPTLPQEHIGNPKLIDASELYEGGKADETQLAAYVDAAKAQGMLDNPKLDLTGGTLMTIYMAVAAEAAKSGSKVNELAFNNPGREGRVVLWSEALAEPTAELKRSLMADQGDSKVDPTAPNQVLDLRLTFRGDAEGPEMVNAAASEAVMQQVITQLRELRNNADTTVRLTGFPIWLAEGAAFAAVKEGFTKVIAFAPGKEVVTYDASSDQADNQMGKIETTPSQAVEVTNPTAGIEQVKTWRDAQTALGVELPNNEVKINSVELEALSPEAGLRLMDSVHSVARSLTVSGIEVFQHRDPRTHDLVPKNKGQNPDLQFKDSRVPVTLNIQEALAADPANVDAVVLALAKEAVNKASVLTMTGITNAVELAIAGKVAHAAHGLIAELYYQKPGEEAMLVKSWRSEDRSVEKLEHKKYYRCITVGELFLLWRDKELPRNVSPDSNLDSDDEPNTVMTYWFHRPIKILSGRDIFLEIDADKIPSDTKTEGIMRFVQPEENYDGDFTYHERQLDEVYIGQRISLDDINIHVNNGLGAKELFQKQLMELSEERKNIVDKNYIGSIYFFTGLRQLWEQEFGSSFFVDFPEKFAYRPTYKNDAPIAYPDQLEWIRVHTESIKGLPLYEKRGDGGLDTYQYYVNKKYLLQFIDQLFNFYAWAAKLPEITYNDFEYISQIEEPVDTSNPRFIEKQGEVATRLREKAEAFITSRELEGNVIKTRYGKMMIIEDIPSEDIPSLSESIQWTSFAGWVNINRNYGASVHFMHSSIKLRMGEIESLLGKEYLRSLESVVYNTGGRSEWSVKWRGNGIVPLSKNQIITALNA